MLAWAKSNKGFKVGITHLGDDDTIAPAVQKGDTELLNFVNDEIVKLGKDNFFHKDYQETLEPVYGNEVNPDDIVVEGGASDGQSGGLSVGDAEPRQRRGVLGRSSGRPFLQDGEV